jgi:WD40 repeat protein
MGPESCGDQLFTLEGRLLQMLRKPVFAFTLLSFGLFVTLAIAQTPVKKLIAEIDDSTMVRGTLKISPNYKKVAYIAFLSDAGKKKYCVVLDSKRGKTYDGIKELEFSPDSRRFAYVAKLGKHFFVVENEKEGTKYDQIWIDGFTSDSKNIVCRVSANGKWHVAVNDSLGKPYERVAPVHFGPENSIAYVTEERNPKMRRSDCHSRITRIIVNDNEVNKFSCARVDGSHAPSSPLFKFSPDGIQLAYVVEQGSKRSVYLNQKEIAGGYHKVHSLSFSPDSSKLCYVAEDKKYNRLVVDNGKMVAKYRHKQPLEAHYSPNSKRLAYSHYDLRKGKDERAVVVDKTEGKPYRKVWRHPQFSLDSGRVAYVASDDKNVTYLILIGKSAKVNFEMTLPFVSEGIGGKLPYLRFSEDLRFLTFVDREGNKKCVKSYEIKEGSLAERYRGRKYDLIYDLKYSPNGNHLVYVARNSSAQGHTEEFIVIDNEECEKHKKVERPIFVDSNTLRYIAWEGNPIVAANKLYHYGNKIYLMEEKLN